MNKKSKTWLIIAGGVLAVALIVGITALNRSLGNNVEIESVIPGDTQSPAAGNAGGQETGTGGGAESAATEVGPEQLNGDWTVADASKVYWSVTTSRETVNFVNDAVSGSWNVNLDNAASMSGEGTVDIEALDSGNSQRDDHVKANDFLDAAAFPQSTFTAASFSGLPETWTEGEAVPFEMAGTLTVKGIEKDVIFTSQAAYRDGQLLLSGTTTVTFSDFGLENPHNVVVATENDLDVRLELVLTPAS